ncbi:MAG: tetratricopeptide repeat protein [Bacteroidetes bacterium]|jgi:tetratricopeptide (TPR) repeat protein|nr:tetratricopeptide repeat protein [Bacteroidota bacterium]MBT5527733.1 tetratricopeptide repeat protein [Cytophagia bacterium]MBT3424255.1 tetratricopeptide repeat protein [Bacteroidota bacterium]MBT3801595.1 tetratricopeptide repeat protein [Bacteroidota bacterium]MBT3934167.1 tetratricopeptide repeat protein [Bacteroidota bacterium]
MVKKDTEKTAAAFKIPIFTLENKTKLEDFFEKYKKQLTYVLGGILVIILLTFAYKNFVIKPQQLQAQDLMFMAEDLFGKDSFELALNGSAESFYGFLDILDEFKMTESGNLARYYTGICYYKLGDYEEALVHLKKFKTNSLLLKPIALGTIGDCYSDLEEYTKALKYYYKAADATANEFTTPIYLMKAGGVLEHLEEYEKSIKVYERIKKEFKDSKEASNADKYIGRASAKAAL